MQDRNLTTGASVFVCLSALAVGSCALAPQRGTSDVPCVTPDEWPLDTLFFLVRAGEDPDRSVWIASQSREQNDLDLEDGVLGNEQFGPVYKLDASTGEFELDNAAGWNALESEVRRCTGASRSLTDDFSVDSRGLLFRGERVPEAGGTHLTSAAAGGHPVIAVLSASGPPPVPFIGQRSTTGQHYHQLISEETGERIGPVVRLGVGGTDRGTIGVCWSPDDRFVIYYQGDGPRFIAFMCFVYVGDQIDSLTNEEP